MNRRRFGAGLLGIAVVVAAALWLGVTAAGQGDPRLTDAERHELMGQARSFVLDNPYQRILLLSTRVERIEDDSGEACDGISGSLDAPPGTAWHVTGYGPFGLRIGGGVITCSGDSWVDGL
jgi:hypothetical protein